jgi:hypothetical protein
MTDYTIAIPTSAGFIKTYIEQVTMRDQFAMAALTGLISRAPDFMFPDLSQKAYRFADAMVEARKEKKDGLS